MSIILEPTTEVTWTVSEEARRRGMTIEQLALDALENGWAFQEIEAVEEDEEGEMWVGWVSMN
jgi:hypothetical protein